MLIGAPPFPMPVPTNPAFNFIVNGRLKDVLKHWKRLRLVTEDALDLMNKIFVYESKRIKMEDILKHPFINLTDSKKEQTEQPKVAVKEVTKEEDVSPQTNVSEQSQQPQPQTPNNETPSVQTTQNAEIEEIKDIRSHT